MFSFVSPDNLPLFIVAASLIVAGLALIVAAALNSFGIKEADEL